MSGQPGVRPVEPKCGTRGPGRFFRSTPTCSTTSNRTPLRWTSRPPPDAITVPWLLIHGTNDESVGFSEAELLKGAGTGKTIRLMPVEGGGHTFGATHPWRAGTAELDTVFDATIEWLVSHLR